MQPFLILITLSLAVLALLIGRAFAARFDLLDRPSSRKHHSGAVPMVGGISIFVGAWSGLLVLSTLLDGLWPLFVATLLMVVVGVQDDRIDLAVVPRFIAELLAVAVIVLASGVELISLGDLFGFGEVDLGWFVLPFTLIAVIGVVNALNMVDGIDGLAGSLALLALLLMGGMAWTAGHTSEAWVALLFSIATIPYLLCNLKVCGVGHRIFLGDAGSMLLGFVIAWLAISLTQPTAEGVGVVMSPVTALWIFAIPLVDTVAIMVRRLLKGQSPFLPDRDHLHHIVMRMGYRDRHALLSILLLALMMAGVGLWMEFTGVAESIRFALFIGFAGLYMVLLQRIWRLIRWVREVRAISTFHLWQLLIPLVNMSQTAKRLTLLLLDGGLIYLTLAASLLLRFDDWSMLARYFYGEQGYWFWMAPLLAYPIFGWFGLYRSIIRFFGTQALWAVTGAVTLYGLLYAGGWLLIDTSGLYSVGQQMPGSVLLLHALLLLLAIGGSRMAARKLLNISRGTSAEHTSVPPRSVIVVGAGEGGRQLASGLLQSNGFKLSAFADNHSELQGRVLLGVPVLAYDELKPFVLQRSITDILLADERLDGTAGRDQRNQLLQQLRELPVRVRAVPTVDALITGHAGWQDLQEISVDDLLQREPVAVEAQEQALKQQITRKTILVLGAGGAVSGELCRQILSLEPKLLLFYDQNEQQLQQQYQQLLWQVQAMEHSKDEADRRPVRLLPRIIPLLGAVQDEQRLNDLMQTWKPDLIYHTATLNQSSMVESNVAEGIKVNVLATLTVARIAIEQQVPKVMLLSNDQAARPTTVMGCSKRVAEMLFQSLMAEPQPRFEMIGEPPVHLVRKTHFSVIRAGDILNTTHSLFQSMRKQIDHGGPITVSRGWDGHKWLSSSEAARLLLQASMLEDGEDLRENGANLYTLDMGEQVSIAELAQRMIEWSGLRIKDQDSPHGDIEIRIQEPKEAIAPQYSQSEEDQNRKPTQHPNIWASEEDTVAWEVLQPQIKALQIAALNGDVEVIRGLLQKLVANYQPDQKIVDSIYREQTR